MNSKWFVGCWNFDMKLMDEKWCVCVCAFALKWNDSDDFVYGFGWC